MNLYENLAFDAVKQALTSTPMAYPMNEGGEFILDVDVSGVGIGGVLQQVQYSIEKVKPMPAGLLIR